MVRRQLDNLWMLALLPLLGLSACVQEGHDIDLRGQDVRLTVLHTSDWHSRLLPYDMDVGLTDEGLGLNPELGPFGGVARLTYLIERERANAGRSIYVDSGDCFQGAPIFNAFDGEVEFRALSWLRPDAVVVGNHEFDDGVDNLIYQAANFVNFPLLAANYHYNLPEETGAPTLGDYTQPFAISNVDGFKVGIIGVANFSSLSSIGYADNSLRITPMDINQTVQFYINYLRPNVNLIIALSHAGLDEDIEMIEGTVGLDLVMGGHLHIVLNPPRTILDASGREVILAHSGAFLKYLGRLDIVAQSSPTDPDDFEVVSHTYEIFPVDRTVPENVAMVRMLEPYIRQLRELIDVSRVLAYAPYRLRRYGSRGGDSAVGNFVSDTMRTQSRVEADFTVTNSLGIRSDIVQGPVFVDQMYNVFPFPNTITTLTMSANEVQEMLDFNAQRSAGRGCATQLQVSGISFVNNCSVYPARAEDIVINGSPILPNHFYTMATNNYIANGGSGFRVLRFNTTQQDTGIAIRDAVMENITAQPTCLSYCDQWGETPNDCEMLQGCRDSLRDYYGRSCSGLGEWSEQDQCLDQLAPQCMELTDQSDFDICREFADPTCNLRYSFADQQTCYAASDTICAAENRVSPRASCAEQAGAGNCMKLVRFSEFDDCLQSALFDAEERCMNIPCMVAYPDGRITRILPTNEYVPTDDDEYIGGDEGAALMEAIQDSPLNEGACY